MRCEKGHIDVSMCTSRTVRESCQYGENVWLQCFNESDTGKIGHTHGLQIKALKHYYIISLASVLGLLACRDAGGLIDRRASLMTSISMLELINLGQKPAYYIKTHLGNMLACAHALYQFGPNLTGLNLGGPNTELLYS